jgi:thiosulfate dehydrogenase [quinone] large subunit
LLLFLTASWHTTPYFLGPDIVFAFAWLPFVLVGADGQPALDNAILRPSDALVRRTTLRSAADHPGGAEPVLTRRTLLAEIAGGALALAGISALLKGSYTAPTLARGSRSRASGRPPAAGGSSSSGPAKAGSLPANAVKLGRSNQIAAGNAAEYSDPTDGSPDILIRESDGSLQAFSAVCTHAGCTVSFQNGEDHLSLPRRRLQRPDR